MGGWKWVENRIHEDCLGRVEFLTLSSGTSQAAQIAVLSLLRGKHGSYQQDYSRF